MEKKCNAVFRKSDGAFLFSEENPLEQTEVNVQAQGLALDAVEIRALTDAELQAVISGLRVVSE